MIATTTLDRRALLASLAALALPLSSRAATASAYPALKAFLDGYIDAKKLPGAVLAIRRGEEAVQYMSAGTLAFDAALPATPDSLFRIYSMTKPITGIAAMKLVEDGKLKLDQPVGEIVDGFKSPQVIVDPTAMTTRPATKPMLIRHLLTHTSGLSYNILRGPLAALYVKNGIRPGDRSTDTAPGDLPTARDLETFGKRLAALPLDFEPGSRWQYSVAMDLMGLIIQRVSGQSFYDYLRTHIFEPLRMGDTDFVVPKSKVERLTSVVTVKDGHVVVTEDRKASPFTRDRDLPSGGGGLVSTARDYSRFTAMLLNEGTLDGARIVKAETARLARSNLMDPGVKFYGGNGFGAAVSVILPGGERPGQEPAGSFSWFGIAGTQMWVDPVNKLSVVLMLQEYPTTYPVQSEVRVAAYKDMAALKG
ncbi:MAG: serine hydrolase domain-containing protein [Caulobacterales bacterium]